MEEGGVGGGGGETVGEGKEGVEEGWKIGHGT